jgi:hypothetical protein
MWHQSGINSILLLLCLPIDMEVRQTCSLFQTTSVAFWYTVALSEKAFQSNKPLYALEMLEFSATCKVGRRDSLLVIPHQKMGL